MRGFQTRSSWPALSASSWASARRPLNFITSAWFTRHMPGKAAVVFASQKSLARSVHSPALSKSATSRHAPIVLQ